MEGIGPVEDSGLDEDELVGRTTLPTAHRRDFALAADQQVLVVLSIEW